MKKLDELNERLARLDERLEELKVNHKREVEAINDEKAMLEEVIAMLTSFLVAVNDSFASLCLVHATGKVTAADLKSFADEAGLEVPDELTSSEEAEQADTELHTATA